MANAQKKQDAPVDAVKAAVVAKLRVLKNDGPTKPAATFPILGEIITWRLSGVAISIPALRDLCASCNLPTNRVPKRIQVRSQVLRTLAELEESGFVRKITDDVQKAVYVLIGEHIDKAASDATYAVEVKFEHLKKQERLIANDPSLQPKIDNLMANYADKCLTRDVRAMITDLVADAQAIRLRQEGGLYLVPHANQAFTENLDTLITSLSQDSYLTRFIIPDTPSHQTNVKRSFMEEFRREYESFMNDLDKLHENGNTRDSTVDKKLTLLLELQQKANLYEDMVGLNMREVNVMTSNIQNHIVSLMSSDDN